MQKYLHQITFNVNQITQQRICFTKKKMLTFKMFPLILISYIHQVQYKYLNKHLDYEYNLTRHHPPLCNILPFFFLGLAHSQININKHLNFRQHTYVNGHLVCGSLTSQRTYFTNDPTYYYYYYSFIMQLVKTKQCLILFHDSILPSFKTSITFKA